MTELQERFARRRDADAPADAQEHRLVELFLEQQDLPADRRLRHVQPLAGRREGAGFGDGPDDLELAQVHSAGRGLLALELLADADQPEGSSASRPTSTFCTTPFLSTTNVARRATPEFSSSRP